MGRVCQRRWWAGLDVRGRALICFVLMAAMVTGCVHAQTRSQVIPYSPPPTEVPTMELDTLETATERALEDAERRTGVARSELTVISAEAVTWADGSLGCPEPGMSYRISFWARSDRDGDSLFGVTAYETIQPFKDAPSPGRWPPGWPW